MRKYAAILAVFLLALEAGADTFAPPAPASTLSNQVWGEGYFDVKPEDKRKRAEQLYRELMESPLVQPEAPATANAITDESVSK